MNEWFEPNFTDEEEDEEYIEVDECLCSECGNTFLNIPGNELSNCPICNTKFD